MAGSYSFEFLWFFFMELGFGSFRFWTFFEWNWLLDGICFGSYSLSGWLVLLFYSACLLVVVLPYLCVAYLLTIVGLLAKKNKGS